MRVEKFLYTRKCIAVASLGFNLFAIETDAFSSPIYPTFRKLVKFLETLSFERSEFVSQIFKWKVFSTRTEILKSFIFLKFLFEWCNLATTFFQMHIFIKKTNHQVSVLVSVKSYTSILGWWSSQLKLLHLCFLIDKVLQGWKVSLDKEVITYLR